MEKEIIFALGWRLAPPTQYIFLEILMEVFPQEICSSIKEQVHHNAKKLVDWTITNYSFSYRRNSHIALAAILNTMDKIVNFSSDVRAKFYENIRMLVDLDFQSDDVLSVRLMFHKLDIKKSQRNEQRSLRESIRKDPDSPTSVRQTVELEGTFM